MTQSTSRAQKPAPASSDVKVAPEESRIENTKPVNIEVETPSEEPTPAPKATPAEKIQTDVREKLSKKSVENDVFVPTNPVALEKAAAEVANEQGFELTRGTSIGARLLARSQNRIK